MREQWDIIQAHKRFLHDQLQCIGNYKFLADSKDVPNTLFLTPNTIIPLRSSLEAAQKVVHDRRVDMAVRPRSYMADLRSRSIQSATKIMSEYRSSMGVEINTTLQQTKVFFRVKDSLAHIGVLRSYAETTGRLYALLKKAQPDFFLLRSSLVGRFPDPIEVHEVETIMTRRPKGKGKVIVTPWKGYLAVNPSTGSWCLGDKLRDTRDKLRRALMRDVTKELSSHA